MPEANVPAVEGVMYETRSTLTTEGRSDLLPLAVDLDGTLLATDVLHEGLVCALLRHPATLPRLFTALAEGRAAFKRRVTEIVPPLAEALPLRLSFLEWLQGQHAAGRSLHLVTAADQRVADAVAAHLGIFDSATGSDGRRNLRSGEKAAFLRRRFPGGFAYAGDSSVDLEVFAAAQAVVLVNASPRVTAAVSRLGKEVLAEFPRQRPRLADWLAALRIHQWSKNLLLFVPLILAHRLGDAGAILRCVAGLLALGLTASGTYLLNDLADLTADRLHATKRRRALAAGRIPVLLGLGTAAGLILTGLVGAAALGPTIAAGIAAYVAISLAYSSRLKAVPLLDTLVIAGLFTLRLALGVELAEVPYSPWLMSFAGFFFLSLALSKRHCELMEARHSGTTLARRGYQVDDWPLTLGFGAAAAMASLQIMILFVADEAWPSRMYHTAAWLYVTPAALSVWLARIWFLAHRRLLRDDPVVFALRDPWSWAIGAIIAAAILAAL
ncbi:MAG: UbiA family prenyltransferase [Acetobacteraceae bacterium]|nr:UbiA family prenyltransferase [Acetobacteraceae bacterium]